MKLLDFRKDGAWYRFRVKRGGGDEYEDFIGIIGDLKELIPARERRYDPEDNHLWSMLVTAENEEILADLFENGNSCVETIKRQIGLFEEWPR